MNDLSDVIQRIDARVARLNGEILALLTFRDSISTLPDSAWELFRSLATSPTPAPISEPKKITILTERKFMTIAVYMAAHGNEWATLEVIHKATSLSMPSLNRMVYLSLPERFEKRQTPWSPGDGAGTRWNQYRIKAEHLPNVTQAVPDGELNGIACGVEDPGGEG